MPEIDQIAVMGKNLIRRISLFSQLVLKRRMVSSVNGLAFHCRWFFVNRAKAVAPIFLHSTVRFPHRRLH
jgi:hypothetical protein